MTEQFDLEALEKALSTKEKAPKKETKRQSPNKPLFIAVDAEGKEVKPKDIKVGKVYGVKLNE